MPAELTDITHLLTDRNSPPMRCEPDTTGWLPDGPCAAYRQDGKVLLGITYRRGVAHGPCCDYWSSGRVSLEGHHTASGQDGEWRFYDRDTGELREVLRFVAGWEVIG